MVGSRFGTEQFTYSGHYGLEMFHEIDTFFLQKSNLEGNIENDRQQRIIWKRISELSHRRKPNWRFRGKLRILQTENCFNSSRNSNSLRCPGDESMFSTFSWPVWAGACLKWTKIECLAENLASWERNLLLKFIDAVYWRVWVSFVWWNWWC